MNPRRWLQEHSLKVLAIRDTPEAIASGVAIGVFFVIVPLFGFKTLLTILVAWLTRSNILAAFLATTLHELALPLMPVIYWWKYQLGYYLLSQPHHWPKLVPDLRFNLLSGLAWMEFFAGFGKPMLLGGSILACPGGLAAYFLTKTLVSRHRRRAETRPGERERTKA
jgi:uncharacterized protein